MYCPIYDNRKYKKKLFHGIQNKLKKNRGLNKNFIINIFIYKLTNNENDLYKYKLFKNSLTTLSRNTERACYSDQLKNCSDSKHTLHILNNVINKKKSNSIPDIFKSYGIEITDPSKISNTFNIFFSDIGIELDDNISKNNVDHYKYFLKSPNIISFYYSR